MIIKIRNTYLSFHELFLFFTFSFILIGSGQHNKKLLILIIAYLFFINAKRIVHFVKYLAKNWPFFILVMWCFFSSYWSVWASESRYITLTQLFVIMACSLIAFSYSTRSIALNLKYASFLFVAVNIIHFLLFPGSSFAHNGATGIADHKNAFGLISAICFISIYSTMKLSSFKQRRLDILFLLILAIFLVISKSKTSILLCFLSIFLSHLVNSFPHSALKTISYFIKCYIWLLLSILVVLVISYEYQILDYLYYNYNDDFLTGRGRIWMSLILNNTESITHGLGFGSVWNKGEYSEIFFTDIYLTDPLWAKGLAAADGGYTDLLLSIGVIGLGLFLFYLFITVSNIFSMPDKDYFIFLFSIIVFASFHNITESTFLLSSVNLWFLVVLVGCMPIASHIPIKDNNAQKQKHNISIDAK